MKLPLTQHTKRVAALAAQVKDFYKRRKAFRVYHGSTNSTRILHFDKDAMVDVSQFNNVLSIDTKRKVAVVEPNVPMDQLVKATLKHGLVPPVVMEFPGITVGGGLQGGAGESSSFKWGTFNRTLNWYDMLLADGRLVRASPKENADLYWGAAGSFGTLGVVTLAEVQLVPAKRYVNLTYTPVGSFAAATKLVTAATKKSHDYIDGILFAKDLGVVITGELSDTPKGPIRRFTRARDPWHYLHAEKLARTNKVAHEAVPLVDYLFRYDRGAFWMGKHAFTRVRTPFNGFTRGLLNPLMHTRRLYDALQASGGSQECIIQDLAIPTDKTVAFLEYVDSALSIYPLWLCPMPIEDKSKLLSNNIKAKSGINVGVWGPYQKPWDEVVRANRELEKEVQKLGGKKWFYAQAFYTKDEFWNIYDKKAYDILRTKYRAKTLPDIYQKVIVKQYIPVKIKRGVVLGLLGLSGISVKKK